MTSLAAARADGYYNPPDWDPNKESRNKYHGVHGLRERARKIKEGIIIIRFEIPFDIWCEGCGGHIAKGRRFNAEKKATGNYYSTTIYRFQFRHHCGTPIALQTDPKNAQYDVVIGARQKHEEYDAEDAEVEELMSFNERQEIRADPMASIEAKQRDKEKAKASKQQLQQLQEFNEQYYHDDFGSNRAARRVMRGKRKEVQAADKKRQELGLHSSIVLAPDHSSDILAAKRAAKLQKIAQNKNKPLKQSFKNQSIFGNKSAVDAAKELRNVKKGALKLKSKKMKASAVDSSRSAITAAQNISQTHKLRERSVVVSSKRRRG